MKKDLIFGWGCFVGLLLGIFFGYLLGMSNTRLSFRREAISIFSQTEALIDGALG